MKKVLQVLFVIMLFIMTLSLGACSKKQEKQPTKKDDDLPSTLYEDVLHEKILKEDVQKEDSITEEDENEEINK